MRQPKPAPEIRPDGRSEEDADPAAVKVGRLDVVAHAVADVERLEREKSYLAQEVTRLRRECAELRQKLSFYQDGRRGA